VHDSDGLMIATTDSRAGPSGLWQPLLNPAAAGTSFAAGEVKGFGLMQRERHFGATRTPRHVYELRPSCWIAAQGHWGPGRVELVQLRRYPRAAPG